MSGKHKNSPDKKGGAESLDRVLEGEALAARLGTIKKKILVLSGKRNVGKSAVAANLALFVGNLPFPFGVCRKT